MLLYIISVKQTRMFLRFPIYPKLGCIFMLSRASRASSVPSLKRMDEHPKESYRQALKRRCASAKMENPIVMNTNAFE